MTNRIDRIIVWRTVSTLLRPSSSRRRAIVADGWFALLLPYCVQYSSNLARASGVARRLATQQIGGVSGRPCSLAEMAIPAATICSLKPCLTAIVYFFVLNAAGRLELVLLEAPGARRRGMPRNFVFIDVQIRILPWFSISQILESSLISIGARSHFRNRNRRRLRLQLRRQSAATIGGGTVASKARQIQMP